MGSVFPQSYGIRPIRLRWFPWILPSSFSGNGSIIQMIIPFWLIRTTYTNLTSLEQAATVFMIPNIYGRASLHLASQSPPFRNPQPYSFSALVSLVLLDSGGSSKSKSPINLRRTRQGQKWPCFFYCYFLSVIVDLPSHHALQISRCKLHQFRAPCCSLSWLACLRASLIPLLETGIYDHGVLCPVSLWDVPDAHTLPHWNPHVFKNASVIYGPKSKCWPEWNPFKITNEGEEAPELPGEITHLSGLGWQFKANQVAYFRSSEGWLMLYYFL